MAFFRSSTEAPIQLHNDNKNEKINKIQQQSCSLILEENQNSLIYIKYFILTIFPDQIFNKGKKSPWEKIFTEFIKAVKGEIIF